ncbi:hypothetical protein [Salinibacterium sp.]|uniref:hypothetical protein n=1 Tax=Salinibacterium sp. TaxID=1915057 RepID=UPI00286A773F|nr:hypothetical protein [Salinibacterium sp.]
MKGLLVLTVGVAAGFFVAHAVSKTPEGHQFFAYIESRARQFRAAVVEGYQAREAELLAAVAEAEDVISDLNRRR